MKIIILITTLLILIISGISEGAEIEPPAGLWKGVVAESIGNYYQDSFREELTAVVCVVRNRLLKGDWHGLVAWRRKDLDSFVSKNVAYVRCIKGIDYEEVVKEIIEDVFTSNIDITNGATYFEDVEKFGLPKGWEKFINLGKHGSKTFFMKRWK